MFLIVFLGVFLMESLNAQVPGHLQELLQVCLQHLSLPQVAEGHESLQLAQLHTPQVQQGAGVAVLDKHRLQHRAAGAQHHLVGPNCLAITTGQGHICEVGVFMQGSERRGSVVAELFPFQQKCVRRHAYNLTV